MSKKKTLTCALSVLRAAMNAAGSVIPTKTPKEILKNVLMLVDGATATLIGTDQEVGIRYQIALTEPAGKWSVLLNQRLGAILREVKSETITLELDGNSLEVISGFSNWTLSVPDPEEFPDVSGFTAESYHVITGDAFKRAVRNTMFAVDVDSTRYALGGILCDLKADSFTLAATDSRRLAVCSGKLAYVGNHADAITAPVIPVKAMRLIESVSTDSAEIQLEVRNNDVLARIGDVTVYARMIEGRFPRYQDVIPKECNATATVNAGPLLTAVKQAMIVINEGSKGVDFQFADTELTLSSTGQDVGKSKIGLPVSFDGDKLNMSLDPKYVGEFLRVLEEIDPVEIRLVDENSAVLFQVDDSYTYIVMPMAKD